MELDEEELDKDDEEEAVLEEELCEELCVVEVLDAPRNTAASPPTMMTIATMTTTAIPVILEIALFVPKLVLRMIAFEAKALYYLYNITINSRRALFSNSI